MSQKVVLINLPPTMNYIYRNVGEIYPATGILIIGTILSNQGLSVQVIDGAINRDYIEKTMELIDTDTIMIGFSVMTSQVPLALNLSKIIKAKYPDIPIVWGGIHPILFSEQTVSNPYIDIVVTGEGTQTVLDLIEYFHGRIELPAVRGIGFKDRSGNIVLTMPAHEDDIKTLPHIDFSILDDINIYLNAKSVYQREFITVDDKHLRVMPILSGLGCCYRCQFCINVILGRKYRFRTASSLVEEIKSLQNKYGANTFIFYDEDFLISKKRLFEFLDLIEDENMQFYWRIWARVSYFRKDYLNRDMILRLEKDGLRSIVMGAESGSQKVLDLIQKGIKVESTLNSAKLLNGTKIVPRYSFIVGLEGEDRSDTEKTYKLIAELMDINPKVDIAGPFFFRYYPGSPMFDRIVNKYDVKMPEKIHDWSSFLSHEGYLLIDNMPWVWEGCLETTAVLNEEIFIFGKLRSINNFLSRIIRKLIKWRIKNMNTRFAVELYIFTLLRKCYGSYLSIRDNIRSFAAGIVYLK